VPRGAECQKAVGIADVLPRSWKYVRANDSIAVWCIIKYLCLQISPYCIDMVHVPTTVLMNVIWSSKNYSITIAIKGCNYSKQYTYTFVFI